MTDNNKQQAYVNVVLEQIENKIISNFSQLENSSNDITVRKTIDDLKMNLEDIRKKIEDEKINNEKLNSSLNNFNKNKEFTKKKTDGNHFFPLHFKNLVTSYSSKLSYTNIDSYSINFVLFICILSYILGAYLAKISNNYK